MVVRSAHLVLVSVLNKNGRVSRVDFYSSAEAD